jgi:hypothetical protein
MNVYFGDNQFLAVNHAGEKVLEYKSKFDSHEKIADVLRSAWEAGIRDFAFTVSPLTNKAINSISDDCPFNLHPGVPYAQEINASLTKFGYVGMLITFVRDVGFWRPFMAICALMLGRRRPIAKLGIVYLLGGLDLRQVKSISLLNVVTDLFVGSRRFDLIDDFISAVRTLGKIPSLYTMNPTLLMDKLWCNAANDDVHIIFNLNESGFRTNPSVDELVLTCKKYVGKNIGVMSIFSGAGDNDPILFIRGFSFVKFVIFGSSSHERICSNWSALTS